MAGIFGVQGTDDGELDHMLQQTKHRGPHESWTNREEGLGLGCCELNVGGNSYPHSHYATQNTQAVVLDGRIYNGEEDKTDAEALLALYNQFGTGFARKIEGDFACAIRDKGNLILARDEAGIRPLYYGHSDGKLLFASEAKGLAGIATDIKEFPPGYLYSRQLGFQRYTSEVKTPDFEDLTQAKKVLRELLVEAVARRMEDNAPGGVLLSGGLDSSLVTTIAYQIDPHIECFTVSTENGQDLPLAKDLTQYLGVKHHILIFGEKEISKILPQAIHDIEMFEESCVHGAIANALAGQLASGHTSCVLTGEGADEFFAGYDGQFRQGKNEEEVASIVDHLIKVAHNTALQRLDRLMAASSIEPRAPFLDTKLMNFALKIPLGYKIRDKAGKWILRQACEDLLPRHIVYQGKRFFAQGSGVASMMRRLAEREVDEEELKRHNRIETNPWLSSVEELYYYRIFKRSFPEAMFDHLVGRWDPSRPIFFREKVIG